MNGATAALVIASCLGAAVAVSIAGELAGKTRAALLAALLMLGAALTGFWSAWTMARPELVWGSFVIGGGYTTVVATASLLGALVLVTLSMSAHPRAGQRATLASLGVVGAAAAASATDVIALVLALEVAAVAGYALVAEARTPRSAEAAMKYLVQGVVASGLLITGIGIIVGGFAPDGKYGAIAGSTADGGTPVIVAILLIVAALAFKAAAAPFHAWSPDAYETAPAEAAAVLSGPVKLGVVAALGVFALATSAGPADAAHPLGVVGGIVLPVLGVIALASVGVGSLGALKQSRYTRMLGYAGVAQVGYALIALASGDAQAALVAATTYAVATTGAFVAASAFKRARPDWDGTVDGLAGLGRAVPLIGFSVTVLMASLAGIPPLLGFWGKFQAFQAPVRMALTMSTQGQASYAVWFASLAVVGIAGSVVSLGYYGAVLRSLLGQGERVSIERDPVRSLMQAVLATIALILVLGGLAPFVFPVAAVLRGFVL